MKLETYITRKGLTQAEFAELADVSQPTISRLLNGVGPRPSWKTLAKIHEATNGAVSANDFLRSQLQAAE